MSDKSSSACVLSVVVPAYNCADHIIKCLDSLYAQNVEGEFEVIVVDDGSTDATRDVVTSYMRGKKNVTLINHSENKKQGAARNTGLRSASGEFVFFMDADDWLGNGGLGHMIRLANEKSADVVACGIQRVFNDGRVEPYHAWSFESCDLETNVRLFSECKIGAPAANKLFRRRFLLANDLYFIEPYYHEDVVFTAKMTLFCRKYVSLDTSYYNYFWNDSSTLNRAPTKLHLTSYFHLLSEMGKYAERVCQLITCEVGVLRNLTTNYGTAEVYPKIKKYGEVHGWEVLEADMFECSSKIFGGQGYYLSSMILLALKSDAPLPIYSV